MNSNVLCLPGFFEGKDISEDSLRVALDVYREKGTGLPFYNPKVVSQVRQALSELPEASIHDFLPLLKSDLCLYIETIKKLLLMGYSVSIDSFLVVCKNTPATILYEVMQNLPQHTDLLSKHHAVNRMISEIVCAAGLSECLGHRLGFEPEFMFAAAVCRSVGLLTAGSIDPKAYNEACFSGSVHFEREYATLSGIHPYSLTRTYWEYTVPDKEVKFYLPSNNPLVWQEAQEVLLKVSHSVARLYCMPDGGTHPSITIPFEGPLASLTREDINRSIHEIERLGEHYVRIHPRRFAHLTNRLLQSFHYYLAPRHEQARITSVNHYLEYCTESVRSSLLSLYQDINPTMARRECIERLLFDIIPNAGFPSGYIAFYHPQEQCLYPRLMIGIPGSPRTIPATIDLDLSRSHPASVAFRTGYIISETNSSDSKASFYAQVLGIKERNAVLYLESNAIEISEKMYQRNAFLAIRKALMDAFLFR